MRGRKDIVLTSLRHRQCVMLFVEEFAKTNAVAKRPLLNQTMGRSFGQMDRMELPLQRMNLSIDHSLVITLQPARIRSLVRR
jgi:hypothetical protein